MFVGLCGGICAGKNSVADYLVQYHDFARVLLHQNEPSVHRSSSSEAEAEASHEPKVRRFSHIDSLLEFVTKNWSQRWVTTDIWNERILETYSRRPFFLLISIDAPLHLRWKRFKDRCEQQKRDPPGLANFVIRSDEHLFNLNNGLAGVIDRAEVRLVNQTSSKETLHKILDDLDIPNVERLRPNWDQYFMRLASLAAQRSNCMKRRVGCVLVREKRVISTGYNGTPRNLRNCIDGGCARCNAGHKAGINLSTCLCLHAEENALLEAGRERIREGSILYCDTCPCLTCSVKITQVGISEVVYSQGYGIDKDAAEVFGAGGVRLRQFSPPRKGLVNLVRTQSSVT